MENKASLTDDELCIVMLSLTLTIQTHEKYKMNHGKDGLDIETKKALADCRQLFDRLNKEHF
ncbi:hypothetical protein J2W98_003727 [Paenibacillus peoriae]|uniref:Spore coat protein n=1 Tax=Paenibacillus peoriae TaxID=59893 RepID=A0ABU1QIL8_9BACL|nr:hypothetical protein [Paenibacillus peoriae]MDR6779447.1 hypothetical protein [Paenibacillus peoriae]